MTWTTPITWSVGQMLSADDLNKVSDNLKYFKDAAKVMKKGDGVTNFSPSIINSYVEISPSLTITQVTNGGPVLIGLTGVQRLEANTSVYLDIEIDGVRLGLTTGQLGGLSLASNNSASATAVPVGLTILTNTETPLTAGSHVFKPVFKASTTLNYFYNNLVLPTFWIRELS